MKRLLIALTVVVALIAASCSTSAGATPAATINGTDITSETLMSEVAGYASNDAFVEQFTAQGSQVFGATEGSYDATFTAAVLSTLVVAQLIDQELAARNLTVTDADLAAAKTTFEGQFQDVSSMPADFQERQIAAIAARTVLTTALQAETPAEAEITEDDLRAAYDQSIETYMQRSGGSVACVSHILIPWDPNAAAAAAPVAPTPEQEAAALAKVNDVESQLAGGADFGTLATTESKDPGSAAQKGNLGCKPVGAGTYVPEFEAAIEAQPIGEPGAPVKTQFGYHIILVRSRGVVPFEEVKEEIRQGLEAQRADSTNAVATWLQQAAKDAEVSVNPMYGTWDPEQLIVPPEGASTQTTVAADPTGGSTAPSDGLVTEGG